VWPADTVTLAGTVSDDGLPAGVLDLLWSKVSGPGTVIFGDAFAQSTSATFSGTGVYVLRLTADDTLLSASDDVTVTVAEGGAVNAAPQVDAGADQTIVWPADTVTLAGTVSDDGLPAGVLDLLWSKVSGPGTVTFGDAFAQSTSATFSGTGVYVLRLTADDTLLSASDDVTVTVGSGAVTYPGDIWLAFDGVDDRVRVADSASLDIVQHITLEAWFRAESIPGSGGQARVVSKSFNYELSVHSADGGCVAGTAGDVQWRAIIGGADRRICGGAIAPGTWHHVAGTYNGSQFVLYLDGNLVAATARSGSIGTNNEDLLIGNNPVLNRPFKGDIDEVRVWRVARTQQQIIDDMDRELSGTEAGLVAYYRLNEGSGQYVFDETDYGNDGVLGSTAGVDADDPAWWPIAGSVDEYVGVGDSITKGSGDNIISDGVGYEPILANLLTVAKGYSHFVFNEGVSGHTSADGSSRIGAVLEQYHQATYFLVQYGTNDAKLVPAPRPSGLGLSRADPAYPGTFKDHMQRIIDATIGDGRIPYIAKLPKAFGSYDFMNPLLWEYNMVVDELYWENGLEVIPPDFYTLFENNPDQMADDLHPNGTGYQSMAQLWWDAIIDAGP
jgi:lysophospholipase L1-like esterase